MRQCPWCGRNNLNVYAYCQGCGRGFAEPEPAQQQQWQVFHAPYFGEWVAGTPAGVAAQSAPAFWPAFAALAALAFGVALIWYSAGDDTGLAAPFTGAAAAVALLAALTWWLARRAVPTNDADGASRPRRYSQVVRIRVPDGGNARDVASTIAHDDTIRALPGVLALEAVGSDGDTVTVGLCLGDESGLPGGDALAAAFQRIAGEGAEVLVFERIDEGPADPPAVRMSLGAAGTSVGALLIGGVSLAIGFAIFSGDSVAETAPPPAFDGTIVGQDNLFNPDRVTVPPGVEVTVQMDNRDEGVLHNIAFFQGDRPGEGPLLTGCIAGCETDEVRTELEPGPIVQEFTFVTPGPGRYAFWCDIHPNTMVGILEVREEAPAPAQ
jgi:plastocyanin